MLKNNNFSNYSEAFSVMHRLTEVNEPFKLTFVKSDGSIKVVASAILRKQTPKSKDSNGPYKFNYIDTINDNYGSAYIPMLLSVNDRKIIL